ncbi:MAG: murein biosynthesis integral membrane protein MurJ [Syntrophorhabdales bacterium]
MSTNPEKEPFRSRGAMSRHSALVASGIFLSRVAGLLRESVFAHYFGSSDAADVFRAAFRIPNLLQNLFGEGALSASFIPVYVKLLDPESRDEADRLASAIFCLLALVVSCLVLVGVFATPYLIDVIAPGFSGAKRDLTISLVRILFPGAGLLVLSAWCLGILNSHRRFFVSYTAPVAWNLAMIATLIGLGRQLTPFPLAKALAWGSVVGSALQIGVQVPQVARLVRSFKVGLGLATQSVRIVVRNFIPVLISRGVVQISAYVDTLIASFLPTGALAGIGYAQILYTLPVSLFGMSVSAAELPALSAATGPGEGSAAYLRLRLDSGLRQIAFFIVPCAMAFLALGDVIAGAIYQTGRFTHHDATYVWAILAGSAVGLLAGTLGRLYASMYYALRDTRTPLYYAVLRVALTAVLGYICALPLPRLLGIDARWGAVGLTGSAGIAAWLEFALLRHSLKVRIGTTGLAATFVLKLWVAAAAGAGAGWAAKLSLSWPSHHPIGPAAVVLCLYCLVYFAVASALRVPEAAALLQRVRKMV